MQTVGLVGGLGPESTIDYYRRILESWGQQNPGSAPSVIIHSLDVNRGIALARDDHNGLTEYLLWSLVKLAGAGCDFAALTANTAHLVFDRLLTRSPLPLLSIVEVCAQEAATQSVSRVGLLGTGFTMEADFYPQVFGRHGIEVVKPGRADRAWLHERYLGELLNGVFTDATRDGVESLIRMATENHIEAAVLAGTELPLLLTARTAGGVPLLDTTQLHVEAIVQRLQDGTSQGAT